MAWSDHGVFGQLIEHAVEVCGEFLAGKERRAGRTSKQGVAGDKQGRCRRRRRYGYYIAIVRFAVARCFERFHFEPTKTEARALAQRDSAFDAFSLRAENRNLPFAREQIAQAAEVFSFSVRNKDRFWLPDFLRPYAPELKVVGACVEENTGGKAAIGDDIGVGYADAVWKTQGIEAEGQSGDLRERIAALCEGGQTCLVELQRRGEATNLIRR